MFQNKSTDIIFDLSEEEVKDLEAKYALLEPLLNDYLSPVQRREQREYVCGVLRISKRTLRRYLQKVKKKGIREIVRRKRSDAGTYRVFSKEVLEKALELLKQNPYRSVPMLMKLLKLDMKIAEQVKTISPHTLYYHLKKAGHDFKHPVKDGKSKIYRSFEADYPNQLWQGDARHGILLPNPKNSKQLKQTYLFAWVDDFSRKIMYARYYWDEKLPRMEDCFKHAVLRWGIPEKLYCDNGKVYTSKMFLFLVTDLIIKKIHHPAYSAWCKGKVENVMKSFKRFQSEARLAAFKTLDELNSALFAWIDIEYNSKIHSTTGQTPDDRFRQNIKTHPPKRITDLDAFLEMFLFRKKAKINKYGKIRFNNNHYTLKGISPGTTVQIRFDPFDLSEVKVYYSGKYYCSLKASLLRSKTLPNIPEEKKLSTSVSNEAIKYFELLRKKHSENKSNSQNQISFSNLFQNKNKKEDWYDSW